MRWGRRSLIIGAVALVLIIVAASLMLRGTTATSALTATPGWQTAAAQTGVIDAAVNATGSIEPQAQAELRFVVDGTVTAVLTLFFGVEKNLAYAVTLLDRTINFWSIIAFGFILYLFSKRK